MEKTLLVISLPGTGKSTAAKFLNFAEKEYDRPAIDFDYSGTRFSYDTAHDVRTMQSKLINTFADHGVKVILTHWNAVRYDCLDINKFKILFIEPSEDKIPQIIEDIRYREAGDHSFSDRCAAHYPEWVHELRANYAKAKRRFKNNCCRIILNYDQYVIDALYQLPELCRALFCDCYNMQVDVLEDITKLIRNPETEKILNRSIIFDLKRNLISNINEFLSYPIFHFIYSQSKSKFIQLVKVRAYTTFRRVLFYDIVSNRDKSVTYVSLLRKMCYESASEPDELFSPDNVDEFLSTFGN